MISFCKLKIREKIARVRRSVGPSVISRDSRRAAAPGVAARVPHDLRTDGERRVVVVQNEMVIHETAK